MCFFFFELIELGASDSMATNFFHLLRRVSKINSTCFVQFHDSICANAFPNEFTVRSYEYCEGNHWILYWIQENKTATYFLRMATNFFHLLRRVSKINSTERGQQKPFSKIGIFLYSSSQVDHKIWAPFRNKVLTFLWNSG
jgi:hypothetical protein